MWRYKTDTAGKHFKEREGVKLEVFPPGINGKEGPRGKARRVCLSSVTSGQRRQITDRGEAESNEHLLTGEEGPQPAAWLHPARLKYKTELREPPTDPLGPRVP